MSHAKAAAVADDLDASGVVDRHVEVHGRQPNIPANACACFLADPGDGALQRQGPRS